MSALSSSVKAMRKSVYGVDIDKISLESFGYFLDDYVVYGAWIEASGESVTIGESIISFENNLYRAQQGSLPVYSASTPLYLDFVPAYGFVIGVNHPTDLTYFPLYELTTDNDNHVIGMVDKRGPVGGLRLHSGFGFVADVADGVVTTVKLADRAVTSPKLAIGAVKYENLDPDVIPALHTSYTHTQIVSTSTWNITHNLERHPNVIVEDSGGTVVMGEITYHDINSLTIQFSPSFSGVAYLD